ncbi:MAG: ABC transporter ATP-binding protein [Candidatus Latescibacterota bacterium]|nr:MAG: ABC transporter ATP-binding protein [Candidatus Latescibacterota bacterium]
MIEAAALVKRYGDVEALRGVSFRVERGEILGYLGPNGAGKSTTVKLLTGLQPPTSGRARIGGFDVATQPLEAKRLIGLVPESGALYEALTPVEYLSFVGQLYELDPTRCRGRIHDLLEYLDLETGVWERRMQGFSKGMKQRVVIAAALLHDPEVLLFDEPLNGLDVQGTVRVKQLIADASARGCTILYSSHLLDVVERVCSRIIMLAAGSIQVDGSLADILARHPGATLEEIFQRLTGAPADRSEQPTDPFDPSQEALGRS